MRKRLILAAVLVAALFVPSTTTAAPIVSIVPGFQSGNIGDTFSVDIVVSNLEGAVVGSFDLDIAFSNLILVGQSFALGSGLAGIDLSLGFLGGVIDLAEVALLDAPSLLALQGGNAFTLATLTFQGLANGLSPLTITQAVFSDGDGLALDVDLENGSIQIGAVDPTPIPEPATMLLLGTGAALAALRHRRQKRQLP